VNPADPLSQLRDIHLPATGGWWPPAPGWWVLLVLLLILLALAIGYLRHHRRHNLWKRQARAELAALAAQPRQSPEWFGALNQLLKRVARQVQPEHRPETLTGRRWADYLLASAPSERTGWRDTVEAMVAAPLQPQTTAEPGPALEFARQWLEARL